MNIIGLKFFILFESNVQLFYISLRYFKFVLMQLAIFYIHNLQL